MPKMCLISAARLQEAVSYLGLATKLGHEQFQDAIREVGLNPSEMLNGFSQSTIKVMRRGERDWPTQLPQRLVELMFSFCNIDVSKSGVVQFMHELDFGIRLEFVVETHNDQPLVSDVHTLKDFTFEIREARATAIDPEGEDLELDLRIGFDRLRMILSAPGIKALDNEMRAETKRDPGKVGKPDYSGHFRMFFASREPLSWSFIPTEDGLLLKERVDAEGHFARIEVNRGSSIITELTAARDALKVRIVEPDGTKRTSRKIAESHREKMISAVARKAISNAATEYVIYRKTLEG